MTAQQAYDGHLTGPTLGSQAPGGTIDVYTRTSTTDAILPLDLSPLMCSAAIFQGIWSFWATNLKVNGRDSGLFGVSFGALARQAWAYRSPCFALSIFSKSSP